MSAECLIPPEHQHLRWHVVRPREFTAEGWKANSRDHFEIVEASKNSSGYWIWKRWGYCGDFHVLSEVDYIGPFPDQQMLETARSES